MAMEYTVPALSLACMAVSALLSLSVPLVLAVLCGRRRPGAWRAVGIGAACFAIFALVLEGACHRLVFALFPALAQTPAAYIAYGCLAAGLFEEAARLAGLRLLCKRDPGALTGFAYGVGHGGLEALYIGVLGMANNLATAALINAGQAEALLAQLPAEQQPLAQRQLAALATTPPLAFLAGGAERVVTLALHIALSVLVWMVATRRLPAWGWGVAVALHAGADIAAGLYQTGVLADIWLTELFVALYTIAVCCGVWRLYRNTAAGGG